MGNRINLLNNYFQQARPLIITSNIGTRLSSSYRMSVDNLQLLDEQRVVLFSAGGEMVINEEEIYRVGPPKADGSLIMILDGGVELQFSPMRPNLMTPLY